MVQENNKYRTYSDQLLTSLFQQGDSLAFNEIYDRYWQKLYTATHKRMRDGETVEEILQEVFSDLWIKRSHRKIEKIYPYLLKASQYQVFTVYNKNAAMPQFESPLEDMALSELEADTLFKEKELWACVEKWMASQPERRREVFRLKFMSQLSTKEISEEMGITQKTVLNQLLIAGASLRKYLSKLMFLFML